LRWSEVRVLVDILSLLLLSLLILLSLSLLLMLKSIDNALIFMSIKNEMIKA
jgi:hypothetical protein